jgi:hypothetical protein
MRISKGRGWLAVVALALGTAAQRDDLVQFDTTDFTEDHSNSLAIILEATARTREFSWTAVGVIVQNVTLYAIDSDTGEVKEVGHGQSIEGGTSTGGSLGTSTITTSSAPGATSSSPNRKPDPANDGHRNPRNIDPGLSGVYPLLPLVSLVPDVLTRPQFC